MKQPWHLETPTDRPPTPTTPKTPTTPIPWKDHKEIE